MKEDVIVELHLLGTGSSVSDPHRTTTMLAIRNSRGVIAVDCGGDLIQKMLQGGIQLDELEGVVLTHSHPDHVVGFPLVVQRLWLHGRDHPLPVIGPESTLRITRRVWEVFGLDELEGMPRIEWRPVHMSDVRNRLPLQSWRVDYASATHGTDTIGLRFVDEDTGTVIAYSSDTEPSTIITKLATDADILVHEATGEFPGHSSIRDAAQIASEAQVKRLLLVHLPPLDSIPRELVAEAHRIFPATEFGEEGGVYKPHRRVPDSVND